MNPTFLKYDKPLLTAAIKCQTPSECIDKIGRSLAEGAEAFCVHLEGLKAEHRRPQLLSEIFAACEGLPICATAYRTDESRGLSDDELVELLLMAMKSGATLLDVMGDLYTRNHAHGISWSMAEILRQAFVVNRIHMAGKEVLISSFPRSGVTVEELEMIAGEIVIRNGDVIKIVDTVKSKERIDDCVKAIRRITETYDQKLLFLTRGEDRTIRSVGPSLGVCMYMCVQDDGIGDEGEYLSIKTARAIRDSAAAAEQ